MGIAHTFTVMQDPRDQMGLSTADFVDSGGREEVQDTAARCQSVIA